MFLFNVYIVRLITASHFPMVHLGLMQFYNLIWVEAKSRKRSKIWTFQTTLLQSVCWSDFIISLSVFPKTVILLARKQLGGYILILQKTVKSPDTWNQMAFTAYCLLLFNHQEEEILEQIYRCLLAAGAPKLSPVEIWISQQIGVWTCY